jgi:DNA mismatch repair protein MutL
MMDQRITILPPILANQLAAGEVIERPASIVKELVENSLDAGSTELTILLEQGGMKRIVVTDNGLGIHPEDLNLAFARHATSKIKAASDLSQIASLGFRGEALASIGSVAKLRIASCWGAEPAHEATMAASQAVSIQLCAHPRGTTVEVRDLFYNTPARQKFLKSPRTEWLHVDELIKRLSISRPDVSWHIYHDGSLVNRYIAKPRDIRLQQVLGKPFTDAGIPIDAAITQVKLTGVIANPEFARSSADYQFFYVNGRMVKDRVISHAIRMAYDELIYPGRYPAYVLHCDLDHSLVDVNVHPTKHEVRFVHARMVHDFISQTLMSALQSRVIVDDGRLTAQGRSGTAPIRVNTRFNDDNRGASILPLGNDDNHDVTIRRGAVSPRPHAAEPRSKPLGNIIAVIGDRLVLSQCNDIIYAIDWVKTLQNYGVKRWQAGLAADNLTSMPLLIPLRVNKRDCASLIEALQVIGFELQATQADEFIIRGMPAFLHGMDMGPVKDILVQPPAELLTAIVKSWVYSQSRILKDVELLLVEILAWGGMEAVVYKRHSPETLL